MHVCKFVQSRARTTQERAGTADTELAHECSLDVHGHMIHLSLTRVAADQPTTDAAVSSERTAMTENRYTFVAHKQLMGATLNTIPRSTAFMIECRNCGVRRETDRETLERVDPYGTLDKIAKRFRCAACGERQAAILPGGWGMAWSDFHQSQDD